VVVAARTVLFSGQAEGSSHRSDRKLILVCLTDRGKSYVPGMQPCALRPLNVTKEVALANKGA